MAAPGQILAQAAVSGYDEAHARKQQRKDMLTDEEHLISRDKLLKERDSYLDQIKSFKDENDNIRPEYKDQADKLGERLSQNEYDLHQLYDPIKAPGRIQQDWHYLRERIHGIKQPAPPKIEAAAPTSAASTPNTSPKASPGGPSQGEDATPQPGAQAAPAPLLVTQSFGNDPVPGMTAKGNADLGKTLNIDNGDGTHSSTFSMSFGTDKGEVLVPGVGDGKTYPARQLRVLYTLPDGSQKWAVPGHQPHNWIAPERPTPQNNEALNQYQKTGKNYGTFEDEKAADAYGKRLHEDQEKYGNNGVTAHPVTPSGNVTVQQLSKQFGIGNIKAPAAAKAPLSWKDRGQYQSPGELKKIAAAKQKAHEDAAALIAGSGLSPAQTAMMEERTKEAVTQAQTDAALRMAERLGITGPALDEFKQQLAGLKNVVPKPLTGPAGIPYKGADGLYRQNVTNPDGSVGWRQMPPDWTPQTKAVGGGIVNTKQHGWVKFWVDPYQPSKVLGFQKITPGRQYAGSTSSGISTDAFGVTTSSARTTMPTTSAPVDFNFSDLQELPTNFNGGEIPPAPARTGVSTPPEDAITSTEPPQPSGSPNKSPKPTAAPPASVAKPTGAPNVQTPAELKANVPAPPAQPSKILDTDAQGHIPENALGPDGKPVNRGVREGANQLLDGVDMKDISVPGKDKYAAEALARQYGWGRGPYLPRELKQMQNANQFLDQALNSKAFMRAIDQGFFRRLGTSFAEKDASKEGVFGTIGHQIGMASANDDQKEYLNIRQALMGTVSGLSSVVRTGRPTEATINRLMQEIPDVMSAADSKQAKEKIAQIKKELKVALAQGVPAPESKNAGGSLSLQDFKTKHKLN